MRVALYARVSTEQQASQGTSLEAQVEMCMNKAYSLGLSKFEIYEEGGASGEDIDRPEMNRLRNDIASGKIAHVICVHPDRLSRDMTDKLIVCREFEKYNVKLVFCDAEYQDTPEGQLFFNMQSSIAQYELAMIRKRTSRGRLKAIEKHKKIMPMRVAPFGYDLVDSSLVINKEEAKLVKMIYEWYVYESLTLREIGNKLVKLGVTPKRKESHNWHQSSINRILTSEIYIGTYWYNRRKYQKIKGEKTKSGNPKKTYVVRDRSEWVQAEVPAIIDPALFKLAQSQRQRNLTNGGSVKFQYLLKGLIRCGHCGRTWNGTTYSGRRDKQTGEKGKYRCYRCPNKNPKRYGEEVYKCSAKTIRAEVMEDFIWNLILRTIMDQDTILSCFEKNSAVVHEQIETMVEALAKRIEEREKERTRVKTMFVRGAITEEEMYEDLSKLNKDIKSLKSELQSLQSRLNENQENQEANERAKQVVTYLEKLAAREEDIPFEKKRTIIQTLVDNIIFTFNEDNTRCEVTCMGHLDMFVENVDIVSRLQYQKV
ncbi:recombinase family protein [Thermoactinomyces sp. DSM 45892]|uniref:recombinase family protein n=1 Tax=Thermoactinomyces sp. DSM 45892 TaxID=1882753 RepID=UPI00089DA200|nr:recombinase family protein [Thermoactinomyces sp. DSM 45892]SDZ23315.1 site-specific DNA recombinase [Thermoactinomyces sp. DSM 45892]